MRSTSYSSIVRKIDTYMQISRGDTILFDRIERERDISRFKTERIKTVKFGQGREK
jgi:hypothetical protein